MNGVIGTCVLYVILPLNKKTHKDAMTHLSLRDSKKKTNKNIVPPFFQVLSCVLKRIKKCVYKVVIIYNVCCGRVVLKGMYTFGSCQRPVFSLGGKI